MSERDKSLKEIMEDIDRAEKAEKAKKNNKDSSSIEIKAFSGSGAQDAKNLMDLLKNDLPAEAIAEVVFTAEQEGYEKDKEGFFDSYYKRLSCMKISVSSGKEALAKIDRDRDKILKLLTILEGQLKWNEEKKAEHDSKK